MRYLILFFLFTSITFAESEINKEISNLTDSLFNNFKIDNSKEVAVFPLTSSNINNTGNDIGIGISELIISRIKAKGLIKIVERSNLEAVLKEIALSQTGVMSEDQIIQSENLASADYIVTGNITSIMGRYNATVKLIDTKTSEIVSVAKTSLSINKINSVIEELFTEKKYVVNSVFRSLLIPGWGQVYSDKPVHGAISGIFCVGGVVLSTILGVSSNSAYDDYQSYSAYLKSTEYSTDLTNYITENGVDNKTASDHFYKIKDNYYNTYKGKHQGFIIATSIAGSLWTINIIDAMIVGKKAQNKFKLYFSSLPANNHKLAMTFNF